MGRASVHPNTLTADIALTEARGPGRVAHLSDRNKFNTYPTAQLVSALVRLNSPGSSLASPLRSALDSLERTKKSPPVKAGFLIKSGDMAAPEDCHAASDLRTERSDGVTNDDQGSQ